MLLFTIYLVVVIALPVALSAVIGYRGLPRGSVCPNCAHETLLLLSPPLRVGQRLHVGVPLQRRWCPGCEWDGFARMHATRHIVSHPVRPTRHTEQLRTLEVGGREWFVMLESWREHGRCYGRLVFVAPSGRHWSDRLAPFSGATHQDISSQALSLSDRLLTYRLCEVVSG